MACRVLITRAPHQGSELAERLRALGADPVLIPAIEIVEPTSFAPLDAALAQLNAFDWLLFTSPNAVRVFGERVVRRDAAIQPIVLSNEGRGSAKAVATQSDTNGPAESLFGAWGPHPRVAAIGQATARALEDLGRPPDLIPPQAVAESLTSMLLPEARRPDGTPSRLLLIRAEEGREHLPDTLRTAGAEVTVAPAYRTVIPPASIELLRTLFLSAQRSPLTAASGSGGGRIDAITFTSSSTARNLVALGEAAGIKIPGTALRISIGPITTRTLHELGLPAHAEAPDATMASLAATVIGACQLSQAQHHEQAEERDT